MIRRTSGVTEGAAAFPSTSSHCPTAEQQFVVAVGAACEVLVNLLNHSNKLSTDSFLIQSIQRR